MEIRKEYANDEKITARFLAEKYNISRQEQDEFACESQIKTNKAILRGTFKDEIIPVPIKSKKQTTFFEVDEHPRLTSMEELAKLKAIFKKDGTVTQVTLQAEMTGRRCCSWLKKKKPNSLV